MNRGVINLIYFGRITESKNVDVIIIALSILLKNGFQAKLDLIGGYSEEYIQRLKSCEESVQIPHGKVVYHGAQPLSYIAEKLKSAHYFLFPSQEKKEGHSNSLTEAMAFGVVPIVSKVGFNESISGDPKLVVSEFSPQGFADRIMEIEATGQWDRLSLFVYNRVVERFTEVQAIDELKGVLNSLSI